MLATEHTVSELTLPTLDVRRIARRIALPALLAGAAAAALLILGGSVHQFAHALLRGLGLSPAWAAAAIAFECISLAGYVALLSLVAGRATSRIGTRESAEIALAGAGATRLLPTAGAGGLALAVWALRRAGLRPVRATQTLLTFLVVLYSVFLGAIVLAGGALALGMVRASGPAALGAIPALAAALCIGLAVGLAARRRRAARDTPDPDAEAGGGSLRTRIGAGARLIGDAVHDALALVTTADGRLAGAVAYWAFDAAVLWSMLNAFGSPPPIAVVGLAYLIGQVANTVPLPGSVSGGIAGVLIAFGVPVGLALPAVLAYRAIAVWLPAPVAIAAVPRLRATIARWSREDAPAPASS